MQLGTADQQLKIEVDHIPADDEVWIEPLDERSQRQQQASFIADPLDLEFFGMGLRLADQDHLRHRPTVASLPLQRHRVEFTGHRTLDIQREDGERRTIIARRQRLHLHLPVAIAVGQDSAGPHPAGDETFHQHSLGVTNIGLQDSDAVQLQQLSRSMGTGQGCKTAAQ